MGSVAVVSTGNRTAPANTAGNFRRPRRPATRWRIRPIGDNDHIRVHNDHILGRHNGNRQRVDKRPERPSRRRQQGLHLHRPTQPDAIGYTEATTAHARSGVTVFDRCPEHKVRRSDPRPIALGACWRNACHTEYAEDCKHRQPQGPHAHGSISPRTHHPAQRVPGLLRFVHRVHRNENRIVNGFPGERIPVVRPSWAFDSGRQACCSNATTIQRNDADS